MSTHKWRDAKKQIALGDRVIEPRVQFAKRLQVSERTVARWNLPTLLVGNVAYVDLNESMKIIAAKVRRRNPPRNEAA
jgi:hypothetical protein